MVKTGIVPDRDTGRFVASGTVWQTAREDSRAPANAHGFVLGDLAKIKVLRSTRVPVGVTSFQLGTSFQENSNCQVTSHLLPHP